MIPCAVCEVLPEITSRDLSLGTSSGLDATGGAGSSGSDVDDPNWEVSS